MARKTAMTCTPVERRISGAESGSESCIPPRSYRSPIEPWHDLTVLTVMDTSLFTCFSAITLFLLWLFASRSKSKGLKPLPGPPQLLLLGNAIQMPRSHEWIKYEQWGKKYGLKSP